MDFNNQPLNRVGFFNVEVLVGKRKIKNTRVINITRDGKSSLCWRDWLTQMNYHIGEANSYSEHSIVVSQIKTVEVENLKTESSRLFTRREK